MDYSMIVFLGMTVLIFGGTVLDEYLNEKKQYMEILEYLGVALVMGVLSYIIWDQDDKGVIKRGDKWD